MISYYFNDVTDEDESHVIHTRDCSHLSNRKIEIGVYNTPQEALIAVHGWLPRKKFACCEFCCCENLEMCV